MLQLSKASLSFGEKEILKDLDLDLKKNEFTAVLGPSGCGKSTLLRVLAELLPLSSGSLDYELKRAPDKSMVFQEAQLLPWRTVYSNITLSLELRPNPSQNIESVLELVGLKDVAQFYPDQLSGGMKMRVSLARALVGQPELLLMDEPFGALDEITRKQMGDEVLKFRDWCSSTLVLVTHSIEEAVYLADRILVMPLSAKPWVLDHPVEVEGKRDRNWRRSDSFRRQVDLLSDAIEKAMESDLS